MDLFCFKCKFIINDLQQLFIHLKLAYSLHSNDVYECCIFNCTSFRSFAKHNMKTEINNVPIRSQLVSCDKYINVLMYLRG